LSEVALESSTVDVIKWGKNLSDCPTNLLECF
jgi:hypothetical protein